MTILAKALRPSKVIFATNVDGIYRNMETKELMDEIRVSGKKSIEFSRVAADDRPSHHETIDLAPAFLRRGSFFQQLRQQRIDRRR